MSVRLSEREKRALSVLADAYNDEDGNCLYMRTIAERGGIDRKMIRRVVRSLARKGMAELVRGLFSDDGLAGSGYCCTRAGLTYCSQEPVKPMASGWEAHGKRKPDGL